jgi:tRNA-Thr(GGU) m(6)t(6)A37 methyltransferase TsaA
MADSESQSAKYAFQPLAMTPIGYVERDEVGGDRVSAAADEKPGFPEKTWFHRASGNGEVGIDDLRNRPARIVLDPSLTDGLLGLQPGSDIVVLYYFHCSVGYELQVHPRGDLSRPLRGVFAVRSPRRPNPIALTTARVRRIEGNVLEVVGLDAVDGSPVLDIKPHAPFFDTPYTG